MTKHFPGGGPQKDGEDPHFPYGREQVYPGGAFALHLKPFEVAIRTGTGQMMPYYGMPVETEWEEVGFGFNKGIVTGLLREQLGFQGIVCTDWGLITDANIMGKPLPARAWGIEHLEPIERVLKPSMPGATSSVARFAPSCCWRWSSKAGYPKRAWISPRAASCGRNSGSGSSTGRMSMSSRPASFAATKRSWRRGSPPSAARWCSSRTRDRWCAGAAGQSRNQSLCRRHRRGNRCWIRRGGRQSRRRRPGHHPHRRALRAARRARPRALFHAGSLAFDADTLAHLLEVCAAVPTVVVLDLDRPAVIPELAAAAAGLIGAFGASDEVVLDLIFGSASPAGKLPFELPSSMEAVRAPALRSPRRLGKPALPAWLWVVLLDESGAMGPSPQRS